MKRMVKVFRDGKMKKNIGLKHNQMQKIVVIIRHGSHKWQIIARSCTLIGHKIVFSKFQLDTNVKTNNQTEKCQ
jgi:hypothetical protein